MSSLFRAPKPPPPPPPPEPPPPPAAAPDPEDTAGGRQPKSKTERRRGRAETIATSPTGVFTPSSWTPFRKSLLGE